MSELPLSVGTEILLNGNPNPGTITAVDTEGRRDYHGKPSEERVTLYNVIMNNGIEYIGVPRDKFTVLKGGSKKNKKSKKHRKDKKSKKRKSLKRKKFSKKHR